MQALVAALAGARLCDEADTEIAIEAMNHTLFVGPYQHGMPSLYTLTTESELMVPQSASKNGRPQI
jgi:hypothetical protein